MHCSRCGIKSRTEICGLCLREQGVISQKRLDDTYIHLDNDFGERKHGFTIGEANNNLPYNFQFTMQILEKLRNFNILTSKNITGTKRYYFTGRELTSHYKPFNIEKEEEIKEMEEMPNKKEYTCKYCGKTVRYHHITCRTCKPKLVEDTFKQVKIILEDGKEHSIDELLPFVDMTKSPLKKILDKLINSGKLKTRRVNKYIYYYLRGSQITAAKDRDPDPIPEKVEESTTAKIESEIIPKNIPTIKPTEDVEPVQVKDIILPEQKITHENPNQRLRGLIIHDMTTTNNEGNSIKNHLHLLTELEKTESEAK